MDTLELLTDFLPFFIGVAGAVMYQRLPAKHHTAATRVLVLAGIIASVVTSLSHRRTEKIHRAEVSDIQGKLSFVTTQNGQILKKLGQGENSETLKRSRIVATLRNEYILSHDKISPAMMAGTELPPSDWINKRLAELGEKWRVSSDPRSEAKTQIKELLKQGKKLNQEGCTRLNPSNGKDIAPLLLTTAIFDWAQRVQAAVAIAEPERLGEWEKSVMWTSPEATNSLGVRCADLSLKIETLSAIMNGTSTKYPR